MFLLSGATLGSGTRAVAEPGGLSTQSSTNTSTWSFSDASQGAGYRLTSDDPSVWVDFRLRDNAKRAPERSGNRWTYRLSDLLTLDYFTSSDRVRKVLTLHRRPPISSVRFDVGWASGLTVQERPDGFLLSKDSSDKAILISRPWMRDANNVAGSISLSIENGVATLSADPAFLDSATYPVMIDPNTQVVESSFATPSSLSVPIGSPLSVAGTSGLALYGCATGGGVCWDDYTYSSSTGWSNTSSTSAVSGGTPTQAFLVSPSLAYLAGLSNTGSVWQAKLWKGTRALGVGAWSWGAPTTVATTVENSPLSLFVAKASGSVHKVWVAYTAPTEGKKLAYTTNDGSAWSSQVVSADMSYEMQVLPRANTSQSFRVIYRDTDAWGGIALKSRLVGSDGWLESETLILQGANLGRPSYATISGNSTDPMAASSHVIFPVWNPSTNKQELQYCKQPGEQWWRCGLADPDTTTPLHSDVSSLEGSYALASDDARLIAYYVPVTGSNAGKLVYKLLFQGAWTTERLLDPSAAAGTADTIAVAQKAVGNKLLSVWRNITSTGFYHLVPNDLDLPPIIRQPSAAPAVIGHIAGCNDSSLVTTSVFDDSVDWAVKIKSGTTTVRTYTSTATSKNAVSQQWNGLNSSGQPVSNGNYTATIEATDSVPWTASRTVPITVDTIAPGLASGTSIAASASLFSPNGDGRQDTIAFSATPNEPSSWKLEILNSASLVSRTITGPSTSSIATTWDGRDSIGSYAPTGSYTSRLTITDAVCNATTLAGPTVQIDTTPPTVTETSASPLVFSPNGDGTLDQSTLSANAADTSGVTWTLNITKTEGGSPTRTFTGGAGPISVVWNGRDNASLPAQDGRYVAVLVAMDSVGNQTTYTYPTLEVDTAGPAIASVTQTNPQFSPNGDGNKDQSTVGAATSDANGPINVGFTIRDEFGNEVWSAAPQSGPSLAFVWDGRDAGSNVVLDGTYSGTIDAVDIVGNTSRTILDYVVDNAAPEITGLTPQGGHNTSFASQPLQARISDAAPSGIAPADISFELTNRTTNSKTTFTATYDQATGLATSQQPAELTEGHDYTVEVMVTDRAGNSVQDGHQDYWGPDDARSGGFRKITVAPSTALTNIPNVDCPVTGDLLNRIATCSGVTVNLGNADVSVSDSRHSYSRGFVTHSVSLQQSKISWDVAGQTLTTINAYETRDPTDQNWSAKNADYQYEVGDRQALPRSISTQATDPSLTIEYA